MVPTELKGHSLRWVLMGSEACWVQTPMKGHSVHWVPTVQKAHSAHWLWTARKGRSVQIGSDVLLVSEAASAHYEALRFGRDVESERD